NPAASAQTGRPSMGNTQGQRGVTSPLSQQAAPTQSTRPGWQTFSSRSSQSRQPETGGRTLGGQSGSQSRPNSSQPAESQQQVQNNSRASSSNYGYSRPPLNMQQPVV